MSREGAEGGRTVLFIGAGRHQRRAIQRVRELGARVVAVDRNPGAPGLRDADVAEVVDFQDVAAVAAVGRKHGVEGVLTVSADRAVPVVAAVAEVLELPGIGASTAHVMTNKTAMRRRLAEAGVAQPRFTAATGAAAARAGLELVGLPAVVKPSDSSGQRGVFLLGSMEELETCYESARKESPSGEVMIESFQPGRELNALVVAHAGAMRLVTLSDRLRPPGIGFGVALTHLYPSTLPADVLAEAERVALDAVRALGLVEGIAYPQLIASDGDVRVVEVAARIPGGQMDALARHAVGVDLVEVALRQALGEEIPDEMVRPRFRRPLAIHFLTAEPGPLPSGRVRRVGAVDRVLASPGVVHAEVFLEEGEVVRPVQRDGDRRGYVIAVGGTGEEALARAEAAARLLEVEVA